MTDPFANSTYRPLPAEAACLLRQVHAQPRLIAHLILVHDVASKLVERLAEVFPELTFDAEAVLFGAATHDIGKAIEGAELIRSGEDHPKRGEELLRKLGVPPERARFAFTHGNWTTGEGVGLDDLLVALADKCWKGKRIAELETKVVNFIASVSGEPAWSCFAKLDEILQGLAVDADSRLAWLGSFAPHSS
jgi:putative nucleotidyltransferase with HDIG domain